MPREYRHISRYEKEILELMSEVNRLVGETNTDFESLLKHYKVESTSKMTTEQLKDCVKKLKERLE